MSRPPLLSFLHAAAGDGVPDAELLRRYAATADEAAFELLVRRHADAVWAACTRVLPRDRHAAEDAFQATFLALARKARAIRTPSAGGWLYRVAVNASLRRRPTALTSADVDRPADPTADRDFAALHEELAALPDAYRLPIVLCDLEELTHADAARRLGWPVGTVSGRLSRGRDALRRRLARRGVTASVAITTIPAGPALVRAAVAVTRGPASPTVASLAEGALSAMRFSMLKPIAAAVAVAGLAAAVAVSANQKPADPPPAAAKAAPADTSDRRAKSLANLSSIAHAMHRFLDVNRGFPADRRDAKGRPLLSWRVELLPYFGADERHLYDQFKLDEPWDSPDNRKLAAFMPAVYGGVGVGPANPAGRHLTFVQRPTGAGAVHEPGKRIDIADVPDGTSNTLLLVEAGDPVDWTKPADVLYAGVPYQLAGPVAGYLNAAMSDGAVYSLKPDLSPQNAHLLTNRGDGTAIDGGAFDGPPPTAADRATADRLKADARAKFDELLKLMDDEQKARGAGEDPLPFWANHLGMLELDRRLGELKARRAAKR